MKFIIEKTSDYEIAKKEIEIKEINTLDELIEFARGSKEEIILSPPRPYYPGEREILWTLEIYDAHRE